MAATTAASAPPPSTALGGRPRLVFVDGSFAELVQELADYLQIGEATEALVSAGKTEEALSKVVDASSALNAAPEKDFTGAYNLLIHLVVNESKDANAHLRTICQNLLQPITGSPVNGVGLALNALQAVFNLLEPTNGLRYNVFMSIVRFLRTNGLFENLKPTLPQVTGWLASWDSTPEAQRKLYLEIAGFASEQGEAAESYKYLLTALRTFGEADVKSEEAEQLSLRAVSTALLSSTQYDFQDLRALATVQALADSNPIWSQLLDIFSEQDLEDYNDFQEEHVGWVAKQEASHALDGEKLLRKIRLLTFTSLAASTQSRQIEYARIAKALQVPPEDVEVWAIDVIRAGLVEGKLSQQQGVFLVHRTTYRVFGEKQWRELGTRLDQWRGSLASVLAVLRKQQAEAEAQKEREAQELERKLASVGLDGGASSTTGGGYQGGQRRGGGNDRGGNDRGGQRSYQPRQQQQRPPRNDNDD